VKLSVPLFELIGAGEDVDSLVFPDPENENKENVTSEEILEKYRTQGQVFVQDLLNTEFKEYFMKRLTSKMRLKIGLLETIADEQSDMDDVIIPLLDWLTAYNIDYHRFYRSLSNYQVTAEGEDKDFDKAINEWLDISTEQEDQVESSKEALKPWLSIYRHRLLKDKTGDADRKQRMNAVNPRFVLRNSIAEDVIRAFEVESEKDAKSTLNACLEACINPFKDHYEDERIEAWINKPIPVSAFCLIKRGEILISK
jgi:uncharacterized protein YdiU (UPF0061 family)